MSIDIDARSSGLPTENKHTIEEVEKALRIDFFGSGYVDRKFAENFDKVIRTAASLVDGNLSDLAYYVAEAKALSIHTELGFDSWTDYITDALSDFTGALGPAVRQMLVDLFREDGMSLRAIAEALGVSKSTVHRHVSQNGTGVDRGEAVETTGLDGKTYPRRNSGGGYRGELKPHMRLNRAVRAIEGIDVATARDQAELRQQLQDTRKLVCELIDNLLDSIQPATESN